MIYSPCIDTETIAFPGIIVIPILLTNSASCTRFTMKIN